MNSSVVSIRKSSHKLLESRQLHCNSGIVNQIVSLSYSITISRKLYVIHSSGASKADTSTLVTTVIYSIVEYI